jgi:hypothetical protein
MIIVGTSCAMYLQVNVSVNRTGCPPLSPCTSSCVNRTEEKIVSVEVPGPERVVYTDKIVEKIVQVNHTVEKIVEVPKIILVEKNLTEGTVCKCKAGYYYSTAGARF